MRLGELLSEAGAIGPAQVAEALAIQRASRCRLGAALVALGHVDVDAVTRALARQHGVLAALSRHIEQRDPALAAALPAPLAIGLGALPIAWSRTAAGLSLVVCFRDPWPEHVAEVARVCGHPVIASVACERAIAQALAQAYPGDVVPDAGVPDHISAVDVDFDEPSQPRLELDLVELDDGRVQRDHSQAEIPTRTRAAPPTGAIALDLAIAGMLVADASDRVADLAAAYLRGAWRGAVILIVREGLALGHRGFGGTLTAAAVESLVVPLAQPSVLAAVHDSKKPFAGEPPPGGVAQDRFLRVFAEHAGKPIAVVPVTVRERVVSLIFAIAPTGPLIESVAGVGRLATAMADGYDRLIREARTQKMATIPPP